MGAGDVAMVKWCEIVMTNACIIEIGRLLSTCCLDYWDVMKKRHLFMLYSKVILMPSSDTHRKLHSLGVIPLPASR